MEISSALIDLKWNRQEYICTTPEVFSLPNMTHVVAIQIVRALYNTPSMHVVAGLSCYKVFPGTSLLIVHKWALSAGSPF